MIDTDATFPTQSWLERVIILGPPRGVTGATVKSQSKCYKKHVI